MLKIYGKFVAYYPIIYSYFFISLFFVLLIVQFYINIFFVHITFLEKDSLFFLFD